MKSILLFYNPGSGDGTHTGKGLEQEIEASGFSCVSMSHKQKIHALSDADIFAVAGGDGTVRKFILQLLERPLKYLRPIGLLALGTANNISKTLKIKAGDDTARQLSRWKKDQRKPFDIGTVVGPDGDQFFIESMGYGVFPKLMKKMSKATRATDQTQEEEFDMAFRLLYTITEKYKARTCRIKLDGKEYSGKYLMVEVMNIQNLGSNMHLAPNADPGDGWMDVVLVPEDGRALLLDYVEKLRTDNKTIFPFKTIRAQEIKIQWAGKTAHIDDEVWALDKPERHKIRLMNQLLHFL